MGFLSRIRHQEPIDEIKCPNCGTPAPVGAETCSVCGRDLHAINGRGADAVPPGDDGGD